MAKCRKYSDEEQLKAAYALNMCSVSVAQIVDYNDSYILEQEYDAILNNLNLEQIPKEEALLNILVELLNTITFFRIQDKKRAMIEKTYQHNIRHAIWSAVPNVGLVTFGKPLSIAVSLASQVGIGYMNYRREKANILLAAEKGEMELQITAIEQFNALKRELFTTAWKLAADYGFKDRWRLTEKQIQQYNAILMDPDEVRKYERLMAIEKNFHAYPPFWYHLGHTAHYISGSKRIQLSDGSRLDYLNRAKEHFEKYYDLNRFNILREDQITASFALEYVDILLQEENPDKDKICKIINEAVEKCGSANDILQLCAISYLKIGRSEDACRLLKILINEEYNAITNGKLLSRIYVSKYIDSPNQTDKADYEVLCSRIGSDYLFPMPDANISTDDALQTKFLTKQKAILQRDYRNALNQYAADSTCKINCLLTLPVLRNSQASSYFSNIPEAKKRRGEDIQKVLSSTSAVDHIHAMSSEGFRFLYLDILNDILKDLDILSLFSTSKKRNELVARLRMKIVPLRNEMNQFQKKLDDGKVSGADFEKLQEKLSFPSLFSELMVQLKQLIVEQIDSIKSLEMLDKAEFDLAQFCIAKGIALPKTVSGNELAEITFNDEKDFLSHSLFGEDALVEAYRKKQFERMIAAVRDASNEMILSDHDAKLLIVGKPEFDHYFDNRGLSRTDIKNDVIAVLDDTSKRDVDMLLTRSGFRLVRRNEILSLRSYSSVIYTNTGGRGELSFGGVMDRYTNKAVNIGRLNALMRQLDEIMKGV